MSDVRVEVNVVTGGFLYVDDETSLELEVNQSKFKYANPFN